MFPFTFHYMIPAILLAYLLAMPSALSATNPNSANDVEQDNSERRTITLSIGENWEPYYSETLENGGVVTEIARQAFKASGYDINVKWLPWARAFNLAKNGTYDGLIGAWFTEERLQYFSYSEPLLSTKLVVIKRKTSPAIYEKRADLKRYRVGVALDSAPHELLKEELGKNLEIGSSAYTNIQKLMAERFDLLVDEKLNVFYIINTHFPKWRDEIVVLSPPLQTNHLHLIISKKINDNQLLIEKFNQGLEEIKRNGTFQSILEHYQFGSVITN